MDSLDGRVGDRSSCPSLGRFDEPADAFLAAGFLLQQDGSSGVGEQQFAPQQQPEGVGFSSTRFVDDGLAAQAHTTNGRLANSVEAAVTSTRIVQDACRNRRM
ncbi:MAG: hypothetical protein HYX68_05850 [Planctomycetes bacterium]|nr:hypothetical protein [Planctomycetota bacterium]